MTKLTDQVKVIIKKDYLLNIRQKDYIKDSIGPFIACILLLVVGVTKDGSAANATLMSYAQFIVPLSIVPFLRGHIFFLVNEKELKFKETFKIMGMQQSAYSIAVNLYVFFKMIFYITILVIMAVAVGTFDNIGQGWGVLIFYTYGLASIGYACCFSTFFDKAKTAGEVYMLVTLFFNFIYYLNYINFVSEHAIFSYIMAILPNVALTISTFINLPHLPGQIQISDGVTQMGIWLELFVSIFVYGFLYWYLDQVVQNEYGTQKPWNFMCLCKKQRKTHMEVPLLDSQNNNKNISQDNENFPTDASSARYHEAFNNVNNLRQTIQIQSLEKNFGELKAIDQLSLNLYEEQIFCLLGHNGAGKTTTISVLTGMITRDKGNVSINGLDIDDDLEEIRKGTGICNQKDVLYDKMNAKEHLKYLCELKGIPQDQQQEKIDYVILKCKLTTEQNKYVQHLSGGNKRKLSLAMALIGGDQIIFLDEPSSGLDPNTRKEIWDILLEMKALKKTVILTTHHLEEAELLAERIGIMAKGQLLTVGSSNYIKKQFGIGYHLKISQLDQQQSQNNLDNEEEVQKFIEFSGERQTEIINLVKQKVPESKYNPQSQKDIIQFTLPFESRSKFTDLFEFLESDPLIKVNLELNTLEDAFINIGMEEDKYLNPDSQKQQEKFTDFNNIPIPDILKEPSQYKFMTQTKAILYKKWYILKRSKAAFFVLGSPIFFTLFGMLICKLLAQQFNKFMDENNVNGQQITYLMQGFTLTIFIVEGYIFNSSSLIVQVVTEKEKGLKYIVNVMGCRISTYWTGQFIFDYIVFVGQQLVFVGLIYIFDIKFITDNMFPYFCNLLGFGLSYISLSYLQSHMYSKIKTAQNLSFVFNFFVLYGVFNIFLVFNSKILNCFVVCIAPFYLLYWAIYSILVLGFARQTTLNLPMGDLLPFTSPWVYFGIFVAQTIVYLFLTTYLDGKKNSLNDSNTIDQMEQQEGQNLEKDVVDEEKRVSTAICEDSVKVQGLYKKYDNGFLAIKNNSFGVKQGEILGLLGPNGAGKSTTFNILTSYVTKSLGSVMMKDIEVNKGIMDIYQHVGICPQFDCFWEDLDVYEHLELFGRMKGLQGRDLEDAIEYFLTVMQLNDYKRSKAAQLSGGNKRKLQVTVALIGGPNMQFLDEPSSGVDAIARRFLWKTLQDSLELRNSAITLTTHSMQEAESLCHKIGILINGRFQCIGSPSYLKQKYGDGYLIQLQTFKPATVASVIQRQFPNATVKQEDTEGDVPVEDQVEGQYKVVFVNLPYKGFQFSQTFSFLEEHLVKQGYVYDFTVQQASMEQIFFQFSKMQKVLEENENFKEPKKFLCIKM